MIAVWLRVLDVDVSQSLVGRAEDVDDAERRGVAYVDGAAGVSMISMLERLLDEMDDRCWPMFFVAQGV